MAKKLSIAILLLGVVLLPGLAMAAHDTLTFPQTATLYIAAPSVNLVVGITTEVAGITVYSSYLTVDMENGSTITLTSDQRQNMSNSLGVATTCTSSSSSLTLTSTTTQTVTITPSGTCASDAGGGGGGAASPSPSVSPSPTVSPSPSPTVSPSPSPSPSPTVSPSPSPTPLALVPIPTLPANPTQTQLQAVIAAIINNIAYLQAELLKLQLPQQGAFAQDLFYGLWNNADVTRLQEFLIGKGYMTGTATGNYYTKTVAAVKAYQTAKGIFPANGRCGPKTRAAINADLGF